MHTCIYFLFPVDISNTNEVGRLRKYIYKSKNMLLLWNSNEKFKHIHIYFLQDFYQFLVRLLKRN